MFGVMVSVLQDLLIMVKPCSSVKGLNVCLLMGSTELIPQFPLPSCAPFDFPVKLFISTHEISHIFDFFPIPCKEQRATRVNPQKP